MFLCRKGNTLRHLFMMAAPPPGGTGPGGYGAGAAPSSKGGSLRARPLPGPQTGGRERIQAGAGSGAKAESRTAGEAAASCENVSDDRSARAKAETKREEFRARRLTAVSSLCDIGPDTPVSVLAALSGKLISGRYVGRGGQMPERQREAGNRSAISTDRLLLFRCVLTR